MLGWVLFLFLIGTKYKITRVSVPMQRGTNFLKQTTVPTNPDFLARNQPNNVFSLFCKCIKMLIKEKVNYKANKEHCLLR